MESRDSSLLLLGYYLRTMRADQQDEARAIRADTAEILRTLNRLTTSSSTGPALARERRREALKFGIRLARMALPYVLPYLQGWWGAAWIWIGILASAIAKWFGS